MGDNSCIPHNYMWFIALCALVFVSLCVQRVTGSDSVPAQCLQAQHWVQHPEHIDASWIDEPPLWGTYRPGIYFGKALFRL